MQSMKKPRLGPRRMRTGHPAAICGFVAAVLFTIGTGDARAQAVDYGSLETLFGEPVTTSVTGKPRHLAGFPVAIRRREQLRDR